MIIQEICGYSLRKLRIKTFENFKSWKILVKNQTRQVKRLRTYNGLDLCNEVFDSYCDIFGIVRHKTTSGTPQQNGLAERFNHTSLERIRCMLVSARLKKVLWSEVVITTTYIINKCPRLP